MSETVLVSIQYSQEGFNKGTHEEIACDNISRTEATGLLIERILFSLHEPNEVMDIITCMVDRFNRRRRKADNPPDNDDGLPVVLGAVN